ncbi:MAG: methyltransferase [Myxococcales bacterium]|nr:methyltransferase [Myxococcales bacterium]MCB9521583.1 methyltransferase [Myxococcales bacterium]MCB9530579.1 methyltransferase [Myxococcales bacterium]
METSAAETRSAEAADDETLDAIFHGRVSLVQGRRGYRFNLDSVLLASRVADAGARRVLDAGAGVGVIALAIATRLPTATVVAVERQPALFERLARNIRANGLDGQVAAALRDLRVGVADLGEFDVVVMNPPYFDPAKSRVSDHPERAAARHQLHGDLVALVGACASAVGCGGRLELVYPAEGESEVNAACLAADLADVELVELRPTADAAPTVIFATCRRGEPRVRRGAPISVYASPGTYSGAVASALAGGPLADG